MCRPVDKPIRRCCTAPLKTAGWTADDSPARYESEDRTPMADLTAQLAEALDVSPQAIAVPDIDTMDGLMHSLFALEDRKLLRITNADGLICLRAEIFDGGTLADIHNISRKAFMTICPLGSKPMLLGALLFVLNHDKNTRIVYPYNEYIHTKADGVGRTYCFRIMN